MQVVGGKSPSWYKTADSSSIYEDTGVESDWIDLQNDLYHWTKTLRPVQV